MKFTRALGRQLPVPLPAHPRVTHVADHQRRALRESQDHGWRRAPQHEQPDAALGERAVS
jgi:hypothetical protein